ncbi:class I SAM-dependent methyltransferase [archaeon]|jgi:ubiquinone/menaquinone biosynthesis C-methylase UbiE|nr:class I SAM-dependent methyltransferase [archaeon]
MGIDKKTIKIIHKGKSHWTNRKNDVELTVVLIDEYFKKRSVKVLDVGCAQGEHTNLLNQKNIVAEGLDYDMKFIKRARKDYPKIKFTKGDMGKMPFKDNSFDVVYCVNSLFYTDVLKVLSEFKRVIKKGGLGIITLDRKIINLDKNKKFYDLDIKDTLKKLDKKIIYKKFKQRTDFFPFKHRHYFYLIAFEN